MDAKYDNIGLNYAERRKPDPRIAASINGALGPAQTVLNAGTAKASLAIHHWPDPATRKSHLDLSVSSDFGSAIRIANFTALVA